MGRIGRPPLRESADAWVLLHHVRGVAGKEGGAACSGILMCGFAVWLADSERLAVGEVGL